MRLQPWKPPLPVTLATTLAVATALAGGCTGVGVDPLGMQIVEDVSPISPRTIESICVRVDPSVKQAFTDGIFETLNSLGLKTQSMQTSFAGECPFWISYQASWSGFPEYLVSARVDAYEGNARLGYVVYDASSGGGRPDRFGSGVGKVRPLIEGMFHHVQRESADTASAATDR